MKVGKRKEKLAMKIETLDKRIKKSIDEDRQAEEKRAVDQIKTNAKFFYKFAQRRSNMKSGIRGLTKENGTICTNDEEVAKVEEPMCWLQITASTFPETSR